MEIRQAVRHLVLVESVASNEQAISSRQLFEGGPMIIQLTEYKAVDTDLELSPEERHILQKLLCYVYFAGSIEEFREKKTKAFVVGWNNSGPIRESEIMGQIAEQLERTLDKRLQEARGALQ